MFCVNKALKLHTSLVQNLEAKFKVKYATMNKDTIWGKPSIYPTLKTYFIIQFSFPCY